MKTILRNVGAVLLGLAIGSAVNMLLILAGPHIIPAPPGVEMSNEASLRASIHLLQPKHYIFPFLAHAIGTLAGAIVTAMVAGSRITGLTYLVGGLFLIGGIAAAVMIPAPAWFVVLDLVVAYFPMAWLGLRITGRARKT